MNDEANGKANDGGDDGNDDGGERFDGAWLALREPADARARDTGLERALAAALAVGSTGRAPIGVLDLGAGTGANLRHLVPLLGHDQSWTLLDRDTTLLERLDARLAPWATRTGASFERDGGAVLLRADGFDARVRTLEADLATALDALAFDGHDLVTGSALLDLAGRDWVDALAARCAAAGCAVLFTLSVDGRLRWGPALDDDAAVQERFERDQHRDKGLGAALGAEAGERFAEALRERGLVVRTAASDWVLGEADGALQRELATGLARAAGEADPAFGARAAAWLDARRALIDAGESTLVVGHVDVLALPL